MLKALKPDTFAGVANAKCGEVYFQSLNSYRIDCAFCEIKSFVFADFLLHIQNEHFENELLKTETLQPKQEQSMTQQVNVSSWHEVNNGADHSENEFNADTKPDNDTGEDEDHDEDDEVVDPVDVSSSAIAIMKWDNGRESVRHTRALKVDYNEESDMEHTDSEQSKSLKVKKEQLACTHCDKSYQSKKLLKRHMERQHRFDVDSVSDFNGEADIEVDVDIDVDEDYVPPKVHSSKPSSEYKCEHCDKVYQGKYTLRQHMKRDHDHANLTEPESFICVECNAQLPRLRLLDEHMLKVHGGAACVICGRRYKTRHDLKRHQLLHSNERNVACNYPGCEKRFFTIHHLRNHSKVHSEQKNFVCESCGYSCRNKETLRVHLRSHTGERPFGCKVCDKHFPSHSGLREHMAMHSTERPHVCKVCGATFSRQKGLYHHKFLHTATKQFVCKLCGNAYAQAAGLAGHMRKHRNDELNLSHF
ncbi:gastrula zinc finger protein XlCGF26.1 [Drosophila innubila]|uniref:gastrula zinc finger protein XlCGF26.1 n=1 Tax=Drosophila innubila TaxID=198719 RepID=UPI00148B745D|nr:gastrula zinc finger protein XlCGF26.1 [Drosophila innubila]